MLHISMSRSEKVKVSRGRYSIFDHATPKSTLSASNFLRLYDALDRAQLSKHLLRGCLSVELLPRFNVEMQNVHNVQVICAWLWSLGSMTEGPYKSINEALYADDEQGVGRYLPIISGLNQYLVRKVERELVTYRGSR